MPVDNTAAKKVPRAYSGQRALRITARTIHIGAAAMVLGAVAFNGEAGAWTAILVLTGVFIMGDDTYKYGLDYFRTLQSWAIFLKLAALALTVIWPTSLLGAMWFCLVLGGLISHAPGKVRHFAIGRSQD